MPRAQVNMKDLVFSEDVLPRMIRSGPIVDEYTEILRLGAKDGTEMGLGVVFHDGSTFWVADGVKRLTGQQRMGITRPWVNLKKGSKADAVWYASGANREHGVRLTNKEKRQAADNLVANKSIADNFTDSAMAAQIGVSEGIVRKAHQVFIINTSADGGSPAVPATKTGRDGKQHPTTSRPAGPGPTPKAVEKARKQAEAAGTDPDVAAQKAQIEHLLNGLQSWANKVIKADCLSDDQRETFRTTLDDMRGPFRDALDELQEQLR